MTASRWPLLIVGATFVSTLACSYGGDDDTETPYFVETTPSPTPLPPTDTPPLFEDTETATPTRFQYSMSRFELESSEGVDLDDDGRADNLYVELLDDLVNVVSDEFQDTCMAVLGDLELPDSLPEPTVLCRTLSATVTQLLDNIATAESMNENITEAMDAGYAYLIRIYPVDEETVKIRYDLGEGYDGAFDVTRPIGEQEGSSPIGDEYSTGTSDFLVVLDIEGEITYMSLVGSRSEFTFNAETFEDNLVGAILTEEGLLDIIGQAILTTYPLPEPALQALLVALGAVIPDCGEEDTVMEECGDYGGIPMGFSYDPAAAEEIYDSGDYEKPLYPVCGR